MRFKNSILITASLLIIVILYFLFKGINYLSTCSVNLSENVNNSIEIADSLHAGKIKAGKEDTSLIVYYFHATARCKECINIENFTKEIVESEFAKEKRTGKMIFRSLNIEDSVNEHYINDFNLDVSTVILSKLVNNKQVGWKNLEHVWKYADDKELFFKYVKSGIKEFINEKEKI
jgi:hypothetical protein